MVNLRCSVRVGDRLLAICIASLDITAPDHASPKWKKIEEEAWQSVRHFSRKPAKDWISLIPPPMHMIQKRQLLPPKPLGKFKNITVWLEKEPVAGTFSS